MMTEQDKIRLIFAFKLKYFRQRKQLSYKQLADQTGLSTSYLHDIEKGKKYPKIDKINALAHAFGVDYNDMVSTKASKKIQPIIDLLHSDFLKVFPLDIFGISLYKLFELFSNTPDKVNAFISTIIKITRNYQMRNEHFYAAALRSYQDMHDNYFEDLELAVKDFRKANHIKAKLPSTKFLENILSKKYQIKVDRNALAQKKDLSATRSFFSKKKKILFLNNNLSTAQENFLLAREIGFQYLQLQERPFITRILEVDSFDKLLNNFKASYFSAALLMEEENMAKDIRNFASKRKWDGDTLLKLIRKYNVTPEMFLQRMTNVLPKHFGINDLFFLRLAGQKDLKVYKMTKEIHLSQLHNPYGNVRNEHYCRRWISINIIKRLRATRKVEILADAQISRYWETPNEYLCLTIAKFDDTAHKGLVSVTIGLLMTEKVRQVFGISHDPDLKNKLVHTTCERCSMPECGARVSPPIVIEKQEEKEKLKEDIWSLEKEN
ncbi:MAG TPA: helix-turn-helix domain-containing protein [Saprospiraceae bacterium]|nr:helix-turn-helix domain-containing protein [Saprospiraceae bacterium]